jgi:hypothetical protein
MFNPRRRSLAQIVSTFDRTLAELAELKTQHAADHIELDARIAALETARSNLIAERQQAEVVHANLNALLGRV